MLKPYVCNYFKANIIANVKLNCKTWVITTNGNQYAVQISCAKKMFKKAVDRNLIKRRIINIFLANNIFMAHRIKTNNIYNLCKIYPSKEILNISFAQIQEKIIQMFIF